MTLETPKGINICEMADLAVKEARKYVMQVQFVFNGIHLNVSPLSFPGDIAEIYVLKHELRRLKGD